MPPLRWPLSGFAAGRSVVLTDADREVVQDLDQVVEDEPVAVLAPPVPHHLVGQDDEVVGLLASVDDDPPELVVVDPRYPTTLRGSVASRATMPIG